MNKIRDELREFERKGELINLIARVKDLASQNKRVFTDPFIKHWCARRWRFFFLNEAIADQVAVDFASSPLRDKRPHRQRIAEWFLLGEDQTGWQDEQPDPQVTSISNTTLVFCPGLLNGMLPVRAFGQALPRFEQRFAMRVIRSDSHPLRGCDANVADILAALNEGKGFDAAGKPFPAEQIKPPGDVFLIGYSKGAPDCLTLLAKHPELGARVRCLFTWAGAVRGSESADGIHDKIKGWGNKPNAMAVRTMLKGLVPGRFKTDTSCLRRLDEYDTTAAVRDLTTGVRDDFLRTNEKKLDGLNIPMFYLRGAAKKAQIPIVQRLDFRKLSKFDHRNDMQVTATRAELPFPMATDLGTLNAHHWDLAYPAFKKRRRFNNTYHPFPKEAAITAMTLLAAELGLAD